MRSRKATFFTAAVFFSVVASTIPAKAVSIDISYNLTGMGNVVSSTPTTLTLVGQFSGSVLSSDPVRNAAWNPVSYSDRSVANLTTGLLNGNFTLSFANGDTIKGTVFEDVSAVVSSTTGTGPFSQTLTFTGGTGAFAGVTGSVSGSGIVGTTQSTVAGSGSLNTSAVPEPASGLFLAGGLAMLVLGRCRGKGRVNQCAASRLASQE